MHMIRRVIESLTPLTFLLVAEEEEAATSRRCVWNEVAARWLVGRPPAEGGLTGDEASSGLGETACRSAASLSRTRGLRRSE
jgi:hypothetical protein